MPTHGLISGLNTVSGAKISNFGLTFDRTSCEKIKLLLLQKSGRLRKTNSNNDIMNFLSILL